MTEAIYKVGDILEFTEVVQRKFGLWAGPTRGLVVKINDLGYEYLSYRLLLSGSIGDSRDMALHWAFEKDIVSAAKRVGHIDISALMFMENDEPDYEKMVTAYACVESANLRKANIELNKKLNDNAEQIYQLRKENEDFKTSNKELSESLSNSEMKAHSRLNEISFLVRKVNELESANNDLKAELDEKAEELKKVYSTDLTCEINRLMEASEKLSAENEHLSNENRDLNALNDELRKSIPEYNELVLKHYACTEKVKKLEAENEPLKRENEELRAANEKLAEANARYLQSMTCAKKQMTEAAKRICEAEEHIDVAVCNN